MKSIKLGSSLMCITAVVIIICGASNSQAEIIFPNLGPGDRYDALMGWTTSLDNDAGMAFIPVGGDFLLQRIGFAGSLAGGAFRITGTPVVSVTPSEGTIGTEIRIEGASFGTKKGKVLMGEVPLLVREWTDEVIKCQLTRALSSGIYDVTIRPQAKGSSPFLIENVFTVKPPEIDSVKPANGSTGDNATIHGFFFGTKKGKVTLGNKNCRILGWEMNPGTGESEIHFVVPKGVGDGTREVKVTNGVGADTAYFMEFTVDEGDKVSSIISPEGGELSTTGKDGTKFILTFPAGSLPQPQEITLAPALSVNGLPLEGTVLASAHMGPLGLKFETPASLTVEFPTPPSIQNLLVGFLFQDDGTDFSPVRAALDANKATFQIEHFTGGGLMEVTDQEILNFAIKAYDGTRRVLDALVADNSCGGQSLIDAINKTVQMSKLADIAPDITFNPKPCIYRGGGDPCTSIFDLGEAARQSLENVIRDIFVQADNQCENDPSKEAEALKCIAAVQGERVLPIFIDKAFDETLMGMKTCGLSSLEIRPPGACLGVGQSATLEAVALDRSGNRLSGREMVWAGGESIASLSASGDTATVTGINEGETWIRVFDKLSGKLGIAMSNFNYDEVPIKVQNKIVTVKPARATIAICNPVQLTATVTDCLGNPYTGCTLAWYSSNVNVAEVDASGLVSGKHRGQVNITAACDDSIGVASITVKGFTGVWDTQWEGAQGASPNTPMTITVSEGDAIGTYYSDSWVPFCPGRVDGTIDGKISGHGCVLTGRWTDNGAYKTTAEDVLLECNVSETGRLEFHLSSDGDSFTGSFWYPKLCESGVVPCSFPWNGVRRLAPEP